MSQKQFDYTAKIATQNKIIEDLKMELIIYRMKSENFYQTMIETDEELDMKKEQIKDLECQLEETKKELAQLKRWLQTKDLKVDTSVTENPTITKVTGPSSDQWTPLFEKYTHDDEIFTTGQVERDQFKALYGMEPTDFNQDPYKHVTETVS